MSASTAATPRKPDQLLADIADYVMRPPSFSEEAWETARHCLMDSLGCGMLALKFPDCVRRLGPVVPGATLRNGARVPGTRFELDPVQAAFDIGAIVRWLDYNDTWLAAEWGHPSDNLGAILAVGDYLCRARGKTLTMRDVLAAMIQAHEIQGVLALENSFNRVGLDHVVLVKVASAAVATRLLGGDRQQVIDAVSQAFVDGQSLRTYRHFPNTGPRKSWAAGDATSRGVRLALLTLRGEPGIPTAITAARYGFSEVSFRGQPVLLARPLGCYVMENILFKIAAPAEFHAQTALEAAGRLRSQVLPRLGEIKAIRVWTQEPAVRIICKEGPLHNPADRDHCLQYIIAVGLLTDLVAHHYENEFHQNDPRIDQLRSLMTVEEDPAYTRDYYDPEKRAIPNAIEVHFKDGSATERVEVAYPLGHRRRRGEGIPLLKEKFAANLRTHFSEGQARGIEAAFEDAGRFDRSAVSDFISLLIPPES